MTVTVYVTVWHDQALDHHKRVATCKGVGLLSDKCTSHAPRRCTQAYKLLTSNLFLAAINTYRLPRFSTGGNAIAFVRPSVRLFVPFHSLKRVTLDLDICMCMHRS